ncbi:hypothetical protein P7C70_g8331, partial [Phenoliferia sp. Uapishka_3]
MPPATRKRHPVIELPPASSQEDEEPAQPAQPPEQILSEDDQEIVQMWDLTPGKKRKFVKALMTYDGHAAGGPAAELERGEKQARFSFLTNLASALATLTAVASQPARSLPAPSVAELTPAQITYVQGLTTSLYLSPSQRNYAPPNSANEGRVIGYLKAHKSALGGRNDFFFTGSPAHANLTGIIKDKLDQTRIKVLKVLAYAAWGSETMGGPDTLHLVDGKPPSLYDFALEWVKPLLGDPSSHLSAPLIARLVFLRVLATRFATTLKDPDALSTDELFEKVHGRHRFLNNKGGYSHLSQFLPYVDSAIEAANETYNTPEKFSNYMKKLVRQDLTSSAPEPLLDMSLAEKLPPSTSGEEIAATMMR